MATVPTRSGSPRQLTTKQTGDAWEAQARRWLEGKGLRFIAANVNERGGEIDLIMREAGPPFLSRCVTAALRFMAARQPV